MKRPQLNALIDAVAFVAFLLLASTGFLLEYQLRAGSGGLESHGGGRGAAGRSIALLWGLTRHEWGHVHYWIAWVLLAIMAVHLFLHWKWIVYTVRGKQSDASGYRLAMGSVALVFLVLLTAAPFMSATTSMTRAELLDARSGGGADDGVAIAVERQESVPAEGSGDDAASDQQHDTAVRGSMTLREIAEESGVPIEAMIREVGLPVDTDVDGRAGRLLRQNSLEMSDLRAAIERVRGLEEVQQDLRN